MTLLYILAVIPLTVFFLFTELGRVIFLGLIAITMFWGMVLLFAWGLQGIL